MRLAIFAIALGLRLIAIEATGADRTAFGDAVDYIGHAQALCVQHAYPDRGNLPFFRAPGLPFAIAAVTACHPSKIRIIKYALACADAGTAVVIASIALSIFGRRTAWLAGIGASVHPIFIASVCDVRSEPLFMLLMTVAIWALIHKREWAAGIATALAALTRPSALICIPLFALFRPRRGAAFVLAAALTLAPWIIRNAVRYHELIVVNDAGGFSFWRGTAPETIEITKEPDPRVYRRKAEDFEVQTVPATEREVDRNAHTPMSRSREWTRRALQNIHQGPVAEVGFALQKAWLYWRPWLNPQEYSPLVVAASAAFFVTFYVLAVLGIGANVELRTPLAIFFTVMWLAHLPYQISMRLRIPFVDPLLLIFAARRVVSTWRAGVPPAMTRHWDGGAR